MTDLIELGHAHEGDQLAGMSLALRTSWSGVQQCHGLGSVDDLPCPPVTQPQPLAAPVLEGPVRQPEEARVADLHALSGT